MVKRLLLVIDDKDFKKLKLLKGKKSWEEFLLKDRRAQSAKKPNDSPNKKILKRSKRRSP